MGFPMAMIVCILNVDLFNFNLDPGINIVAVVQVADTSDNRVWKLRESDFPSEFPLHDAMSRCENELFGDYSTAADVHTGAVAKRYHVGELEGFGVSTADYTLGVQESLCT